MRLGSMCWLSCEYITSTPMSRFFTGFHTVREPTPQTSKAKSQPGTAPRATGNVPEFGVTNGPPGASCVRTGEFGLLHMMALPAPPGSHPVIEPNTEVRNAGVQ